MKTFLAIIGFLFLLFSFCLFLFIWRIRRRIRNIRDNMEENFDDEAFRRMADKNYYRNRRNDAPQFDDDYFKGSNKSGTQGTGKSQTQSRRTTQTAGGVTIIDSRDPQQADKKIFAHDEGEYVDFTEE